MRREGRAIRLKVLALLDEGQVTAVQLADKVVSCSLSLAPLLEGIGHRTNPHHATAARVASRYPCGATTSASGPYWRICRTSHSGLAVR
jgi:hypothetical protein